MAPVPPALHSISQEAHPSDSKRRSPTRRRAQIGDDVLEHPTNVQVGPLPGLTPRHVAIRSRVLIQRTNWGARGLPLPKEMLPVTGGESGSNSARAARSTKFIGDGESLMPVEFVKDCRVGRRQATYRCFSLPMRSLAAGQVSEISERYGKHPTPPLTREIRHELKVHLDGLQSVCRTDLKAHQRSLRFFLRELWEVCQLLKAPISKRMYRRSLAPNTLNHFVQLLPENQQADLAPSGTEMMDDSFLTLTVMLAIGNFPWEFTFNQVLHRTCNCAQQFPGSSGCLLPEAGLRPFAMSCPGTPVGRSQLKGSLPERPSTGSVVAFQQNVSQIFLEQRRRQERHFSPFLLEWEAALQSRFLAFTSQVPGFLNDLLGSIPENPPADKLTLQAWERWVSYVVSEVCIFDRYYTQFEAQYMDLVQKLIEDAQEPAKSMAGPSGALIRGACDPFQQVQAASLCQRLGLLKQKVNFGYKRGLVHFDPGLLEKARRALQIDTYPCVKDMAQEMIVNWEHFCQVASNLEADYVKPELKENAELKEAILKLEAVWAECQYVLHSGSLDFIPELLNFISTLKPMYRWHLNLAMRSFATDSSRRQKFGGFSGNVTFTPEDMAKARVTLYQTAPIMLYMDQLWRSCSQPDAAQTGRRTVLTQGQIISDRVRPGFVELFCPKDERHLRLKRDIAKFDEPRFQKFMNFLASEEETSGFSHGSEKRGQENYFQMVYRTLKEIASFPAQEVAEDALAAALASQARRECHQLDFTGRDEAELLREHELLEGCARWICLLFVAQTVEPELFLSESPLQVPSKDRDSKDSKRRRSSVHADTSKEAVVSSSLMTRRTSRGGVGEGRQVTKGERRQSINPSHH